MGTPPVLPLEVTNFQHPVIPGVFWVGKHNLSVTHFILHCAVKWLHKCKKNRGLVSAYLIFQNSWRLTNDKA